MVSIKLGGTASIFEEIRKELKENEQLFITNLQYIGERAVKEARLRGTYIDRTGNLRSSIGYVILKDGYPIYHGRGKKYGNGSEGQEKAKKFLDRLARKYPKGYVLIVCAGMEYASYVEDIHGKDVLTAAKLLAEALIQKIMVNNKK